MPDPTPEPCGCRVVDWTPHLTVRTWRIDYCRTHAAAFRYRDEAHYLTKERDEAVAINAALLAALEQIEARSRNEVHLWAQGIDREVRLHDLLWDCIRDARAAIAQATERGGSRDGEPKAVRTTGESPDNADPFGSHVPTPTIAQAKGDA